MASIELRRVSKGFGTVAVLKDVSLKVDDGRFTVLLGPSGCGKSTALRLVAGLEAPDSGSVLIDGKQVDDVSPKDRDIAMVFQDYALYPHLSVYENIAFGLRARKTPANQIKRTIEETGQLVQVAELFARKPSELSGGQRQRVALARAIARRPKAFLFDEPLSNLDAKLRASMRAELKRLHGRLKATCLYVTHDQIEAMTLGDRVVLMNQGAVEQAGTPRELYYEPRTRFAAEFLGSIPMNFLAGLASVEGGRAVFVAEGGTSIPLPPGLKTPAGARALGIRPEHVSFSAGGENFDTGLRAEVEFSEFTGSDYLVDADVGGVKVRVVAKSEVPSGQKLPLFFHKQWIYLY